MPIFKLRTTTTVDWDKTPRLAGRIESVGMFTGSEFLEATTTTDRVVEVEEVPAEGDKRRGYLIVDTGIRRVRVFESVGLVDLFAAGVTGDGVVVIFHGMKSLKRSAHSMRDFEVLLFEWPETGFEDSIFRDPNPVQTLDTYDAPPFPGR